MDDKEEQREYFAHKVMEYMSGEWNRLSPKIEKIVRTLLKRRYTQRLTWNQHRYIEQAYGMPDQEVSYCIDACDLVNAIEMYKEETTLKFWDQR